MSDDGDYIKILIIKEEGNYNLGVVRSKLTIIVCMRKNLLSVVYNLFKRLVVEIDWRKCYCSYSYIDH